MAVPRTVYAGTCKQDGTLVCGVVEEQGFCDESSWVPPFVVADMGHPNRICAYYPDTMVIGRCDGNNDGGGFCSNLASRCTDPESFVPRDPDCRITMDYKKGGNKKGDEQQQHQHQQYKPTTYGRCGTDRCVWSPEDCGEGEPYTSNDQDCTADKVKLGACLDGFGYCTVSPKVCGTVEPYYTHNEFLEKFDTNCYLADLPRVESVVLAQPTATTTATTTTTPTPTTTPTLPLPIGASKSSPLSETAILGIVVGVGLPVGMVLGFLAARARRGPPPAEIESPNDEDTDPPPRTIAVGGKEVTVDDSEDLSIT